MHAIAARAERFCTRFGLKIPLLLAPMAGACPTALSIAVANAGGLGACGALLMPPDDIERWAAEFRAESAGPFQMNLWIPDPPPARDEQRERSVREFLCAWGPEVPATAGDAMPPNFQAQCEAMLRVEPPIISSIMGLYPPSFVATAQKKGIAWFANVSTLAEAKAAEAAGADVLVVQGMEAGGHRGSFESRDAETQLAGLFALLPIVADAVGVPVVASGGIADARGAAAAMMLGASAVQIGTGFLRTSEAGIATAWADALGHTPPEGTMITRAFSGRAGRAVATRYVRAFDQSTAPRPAPYPVQRGLTAAMRAQALQSNDIDRMQAWAGQAAMLARRGPAGALAREIWSAAQSMLGIALAVE